MDLPGVFSLNGGSLSEDETGEQPMTFTYLRLYETCLLYTSDAADERSSVALGGRRIIKKKNDKKKKKKTRAHKIEKK